MKILIAMAFALASPFIAGAEESAAPDLGCNCKRPVIKSIDLQWPGALDREALVFLEFDLSAAGEVGNIRLGEGGFHSKRFVDSATQALSKAKFEPAIIDGKPVPAEGLRQPFRFSPTGDIHGITDGFRKELDKVDKFVQKGDFAGAHFHTEWMLAQKVKFKDEFSVLQAQLAYTHAGVGNVHRAIIAAREATQTTSATLENFSLREPIRQRGPWEFLLPPDMTVGLLNLRMRLAESKGLLLESLLAYNDLAGLARLGPEDPRSIKAEAIRVKLESSEPLRGELKIGESGRWNHLLFRRTFATENVQGKINQIDLRCGSRWRTVELQPGAPSSVPDGWRNCTLMIAAEPGTQFDIVEYPEARPSTAPGPRTNAATP